MLWRRSSQALSGNGCSAVVGSAAAGRASVNASCAPTRQIAANNIAKTTRTSIERARLFDHRLDCKRSVSMRPDLQAVCHLEYGRQNAENNQTYQSGDHDDDHRRNQLRNQADGLV